MHNLNNATMNEGEILKSVGPFQIIDSDNSNLQKFNNLEVFINKPYTPKNDLFEIESFDLNKIKIEHVELNEINK